MTGPGFPDAVFGVDGVIEGTSKFSDAPALWLNGKEIAHLGPTGAFDVRLTRAVIRRLRPRLTADRRVRLRPSSSADWAEVLVGKPQDRDLLVELVGLAAQAHR